MDGPESEGADYVPRIDDAYEYNEYTQGNIGFNKMLNIGGNIGLLYRFFKGISLAVICIPFRHRPAKKRFFIQTVIPPIDMLKEITDQGL